MELEPPVRKVELVTCHCLIVMTTVNYQAEKPCTNLTSGPDDPFCSDCTDRHVDSAMARSPFHLITTTWDWAAQRGALSE